DQLSRALHHGWAPSTLQGYNSAVNRFIRFCKKEKIHRQFWLPADELVLCALAASSEGRHAGSTARNALAGLKAWHVAQNAEWKGGKRLKYVLNGVENRRPALSRRPPRLPVTRNLLRILRANLDLADPVDMAVFAAVCVAFWGQCHLGELLPPSTTRAASKRSPHRASLTPPSPTSPSYVIHLPSTKTRFSQGEDVVILRQRGSSDPIRALRHHLFWNNPAESDHLFVYKTSFGTRPLTRRFFMKKCNAVWIEAGLPRLTGHSFRIGGTTELLLAGVSPDIVKKAGRWSSDSFLRYWR
ncbi:DNA breaking-rejoining enzyme, partial [Punctularia strigosozonata HHB-11173 SS5]|uniref:DNA breaking-rejoining enzyme n=1 Tax=Punctularia strigosozonata (strain HHB-11173) TaxID=741275 RepID=UPI0004416F6B